MMNSKVIILNVTGITEIQHGEMLMNYAENWVYKYFHKQNIVHSAFLGSKRFWEWWQTQWTLRDDEFLNLTGFDIETIIKDDFTKNFTLLLYKEHHNINDLLIYPSEGVYTEVKGCLKEQNWKPTPLESPIIYNPKTKHDKVRSRKK